MILVDFNGLMYQYIYRTISILKPEKINDYYNTLDFLPMAKSFILDYLFDTRKKYISKGEIILCVDNTKNGNWRSRIYNRYKYSRKESRENSDINYSEVFDDIEKFLNAIKDNGIFKVIKIEHAEADDCILCLAKEYSKTENILIISADKDMIQAQKSGNVTQYSPLTKKFIVPETKDSTMKEWLIEHVVLGDAADNIPRIFDETEFTDDFKNFSNITEDDFKNMKDSDKDNMLDEFYDLYPLSDVWKKQRIGVKKVQKMIKDNTIDSFIEKYKDNYERNKRLILEEYIPDDIRKQILDEYKIDRVIPNRDNFIGYLNKNYMGKLAGDVPFYDNTLISIDDFF